MKGDLFVQLDAQGSLFLRTDDLDALYLKFDASRVVMIDGERYVPTDAVLDVTPAFNESKLTLSFIGKTTEEQKTVAELFPLSARPKDVYSPHEMSAFLNYGLSENRTSPDGLQTFSATTKAGWRTGDVFVTSDQLYTKTDQKARSVRLMSSATYERRADLQWFTLGDQFTRSGDLGSTVNMGGIGISKVYRIDPYLITRPVFDLQGSVVYPTQAEIYLDGLLVGRQQIAPGTFDLKNIYSYSGSHQVEVVLKDPFGNEQRIAYPLYFDTFMLRRGLHEYSYNIGFLREQYGVKSNEYGKSVFSAFHRYGVSNFLNIGASAEGSDEVKNGGLFTNFTLPYIGAFNLSGAISSSEGARGSAGSFQYSYQLGGFSANAHARSFSKDYGTVGAPSAAASDRTRYERSLAAGFSLMPLGSLSLGYSESEAFSSEITRVLSANYSRTISRMASLFATMSRTQAEQDVSSFFIGLNFNFDVHLHGAMKYSKSGDTNTETAQLQKDLPVGEGYGYRATVNRTAAGTATTEVFNPNVQYNGPYGIYSFDMNAQNTDGNKMESYTLSAAGALVYAGGFYGLARPVNDSFSIVMLDKVKGAKVLNNGVDIGTTGSSGKLVVPTITSYGRNQITINLQNLDMDYGISGINRAISPSLWSGSCLGFDVVKMQAVTGNLVATIDGKKTPMEYVEISVHAGDKILTSPTGKNGEFYIENTVPRETTEGLDQQSCRAIAERRKKGGQVVPPGVYPASAELDGKTCVFEITFPETEDVITDLGEIQCADKKKESQQVSVAPPPPPPVAEPQNVEQENNLFQLVSVDLRFNKKGSLAEKKDRTAVAALVRYLKQHPGLAVMIEVHGDRHGTPEASRRVELKQADAIRRYLLSVGVNADRILEIRSSGQRRMLCPDATTACDKMNRRGVIRLVRQDRDVVVDPGGGGEESRE